MALYKSSIDGRAPYYDLRKAIAGLAVPLWSLKQHEVFFLFCILELFIRGKLLNMVIIFKDFVF